MCRRHLFCLFTSCIDSACYRCVFFGGGVCWRRVCCRTCWIVQTGLHTPQPASEWFCRGDAERRPCLDAGSRSGSETQLESLPHRHSRRQTSERLRRGKRYKVEDFLEHLINGELSEHDSLDSGYEEDGEDSEIGGSGLFQ